MHGWMRERAFAVGRVEVLDEGRECVEFWGGGVPAYEHLFGVGFEVKGEHGFVVVHVDFDLWRLVVEGGGRMGRMDLFLGFVVADGEAVADFDLAAVFTTDAEKRADYALLVGVSSE